MRRPSFTWWGGALGAALLGHTVCRLCRFAFDRRTGASNRTAIVCYVLVTNAALLGVFSALDRFLP